MEAEQSGADMEPVFLRFQSYDFELDQRFQDGLKLLPESNNERQKLQDMKLFFYNRFVEPIDRTSYKQWSSASPRVPQTEQRTPSDSERGSDLTNTGVVQGSAELEVKQLSFAEVMRLVQEGKEVPGAKKLDIKPSNQNPSPSQMERRRKPWETAPSSQ